MSLINGPKKIKPNSPADKKNALPAAVAGGALSMFQNLTGIRFDPAPTYLFYVEISGLVVALFTECSGIGAKRTFETFHEGGLNDHAHTLPGKIEYQNIILKRGLSISRELWNWFVTGLYDFQVKRVNLSIVQGAPGHSLVSMLTSSGLGIIKRWNIENAYPVSWKLSDLNVSSFDSVAIETIEIAHTGISLDIIAGTPMSITGTAISAMS